MPSVFHPEPVTDTDSVILTHPPGYTVTRANTPQGGEAYEVHENTSAPHPHLLYDVQRTTTSYETPALCNTAGDTLYAPQTFRPQVRVHTELVDSPIHPCILETLPPHSLECHQ